MATYKAFDIKRWNSDSKVIVGQLDVWIPARPTNYRVDGLWSRLKQAWFVLIGKYDALDWEEDRSPEYWVKRLRIIRKNEKW